MALEKLGQIGGSSTRRLTTKALGERQKAAWGGLLLLHASLTRKLNSVLESERLISLELYDVLLALEDAPERRLKMSELAAAVVFSPSGLTRLVDRLERLGYVRRQPHPVDGRSLLAVLTDEGAAARAATWPRYSALLQEHLGSHLTDRDAETIVRVAKKVLNRKSWPGCHPD